MTSTFTPSTNNKSYSYLISTAFSENTWKKHSSALNNFNSYQKFLGYNVKWPIELDTLCSLVEWNFSKNKLKTSTIESYLASLKCFHKLENLNSENFNNYVLKTVLRGAESQELYSDVCKATRKVMTVALLKLIGHEIAITAWSIESKQIVWSACTTAFFGSFRLGEILAQKESNFSPNDTLLWKDIMFMSDDHILIHVKTSKSREKEGEFVDIFSFSGQGICPVKSLLKLKELSGSNYSPDLPVFSFSSSKFLTPRSLTQTIQTLLFPVIGSSSMEISGHSFRAAIPSVLAKFPEVSNSSEIMGWGRWKSSAYITYTRLQKDQKRAIFAKITSLLLSQ